MKHSICGFNHAALVLVYKLDYDDAQILRCIIDFRDTGKMRVIFNEGEQYFWVSHEWIAKELIGLPCKNKRVIARRMQKYVECGLMKSYVEQGRFTYYRFIEAELNNLLSFPDPVLKSTHPVLQSTGTLHSKVQVPALKSTPIDPSISNPSINNQDISGIFSHWNSKKSLIAHKKLSVGMKRNIEGRLKEHTAEELKEAIDSYALILASPEKYWYNYKNGLDDFFRAGQQKPGPYVKFLPGRFVESNFLKTNSVSGDFQFNKWDTGGEVEEVSQQPKTEREEFEEKFYKYQAKVVEAIPDYNQRDDIPPDNDRDTWYKAWQAVKAEGKRMAYKTIVDIFQRKKNETEEY